MQASTALAALPSGSLDAYLAKVRSYPVLKPEEERALATAYRDHNDLEAAGKLVLHNLRFVAYIARNYSGYGLAMGDLIQEGTIGLMKAVKRFDPRVGVRLVSFAVHWIRSEIHEFILKNKRIVKMATTKAQRKLLFNLSSMKEKLGKLGSLSRSDADDIAERLSVSTKDVFEMETRLEGRDIAYDQPASGEQSAAPADYLADESDPAEEAETLDWREHCRDLLAVALGALSPRERDIIKARRLSEDKKTLECLAQQYGISRERVRQIEARALAKLTKRVREDSQPLALPATG